MHIFGTNLLGGLYTEAFIPTNITNINSVTLKNGMYDDLYLTNKLLDQTDEIPNNFDFDTALHAKFDDKTQAGNCDWDPTEITHMIIKRRRADEFTWYTIAVKEVSRIEDYSLNGIDYMNASGVDYEYAVVPVSYGLKEGEYYTDNVHSDLFGIFLLEKNKIIGTSITDAFCDTTRNVPGSYVETIHNKYPTAIDTSIANYDTGSCTGMFISANEEGCDYQFEESDYNRTKYQREIIDFLADRKPKILKHSDGRMWLVKINTGITDAAQDYYGNRNISFEWTEIGDYKSEEDLYYTDLSDITEEWWN